MGVLKENFKFTGSLGDFTAYANLKTNKITIQQKGGPSAEKLERSPAYSTLRSYRQEFKGMSKLSKSIRHAMGIIQKLPDYRMAGALTGHMAHLKELDTINRLGQRTALLSQKRNWLEGWQISVEYIFEQVVRNPVEVNISREDLSASIVIPALFRGANFQPPGSVLFYRWIASLGVVHDYYFDGSDNYKTADGFDRIAPEVFTSPWKLTSENAADFSINLQLPSVYLPLPAAASLVCTIAVEGGSMKPGGMIMNSKYRSAGKVVKVV